MWTTHRLIKLLALCVGVFLFFHVVLFGNWVSVRHGRTRFSRFRDEKEWNAVVENIRPPPLNMTRIYVREHARLFRQYMKLAELSSPGRMDIFRTDPDRAELLKSIEHRVIPYAKTDATKASLTDRFKKFPERKGAKGVLTRRKRGIVISAGSGQFQFTLGLVGTIRLVFNSSLPIEIWNDGNSDMTSEQQNAIKKIGGDTTFRNIYEYKVWTEDCVGREKGYNVKPFALLASNFDEPMLVDADTVFLQDPAVFWEDEGYKETGALFFHDRLMGAPRSFKWMVDSVVEGRLPSKELNGSRWWTEQEKEGWVNEMDSGAVLMDKSRPGVLAAVMFAAWMNSADAYDRYGNFLEDDMGGDKETYWVACEALQIPYHFNPAYGSALGAWNKKNNVTVTEAIMHVDTNGKPLWYNGVGFRSSKKEGYEGYWIDPDSYTLQDEKGRWRQMTSWFFPLGHSGIIVPFEGEYKEILRKQVETVKMLEKKHEVLLKGLKSNEAVLDLQ